MNISCRAVAAALVLTLAVAALPAVRAQQLAQRITVAELKPLYDAGKVIVLDVRSAEAYQAEHVAGALSVPLAVVGEKAEELKSKGKLVVAYCT